MLRRSTGGAVLVVVVAACGVMWARTGLGGQQPPAVQRKVLLKQDLSVPGYEADLVSVEIPVGGREGRHTHPGSAFVHVEEGALTLDYEGKPSVTYKPGESFYIEPGKVHEGINGGKVPVKAIATFIIEKGKPLAAPAK